MKTPVLESLSSKVKRRHQHRCFPENITKYLRKPIMKDICEWLLLITERVLLHLYASSSLQQIVKWLSIWQKWPRGTVESGNIFYINLTADFCWYEHKLKIRQKDNLLAETSSWKDLIQSFPYKNHCECYKKLASRSWPVLFTLNLIFSYTCTLLFCCKIKSSCTGFHKLRARLRPWT